ncbi:MAG: HprK-related kinase B [Desulfosarcinaceae bacterium]|nr:HprK-related kinase B [Desulfosarcinaceae bacterium]
MAASPASVAQRIAAIRTATPAPYGVGLQFEACHLQVDCSTTALRDGLIAYFAPFVTAEPPRKREICISVHEAPPPEITETLTVKQPDPGKTKIKEAYLDLTDGRIVRKRLTGMCFYFSDREHLAVGPCQENLNQVVNFINNRFIQWRLCQGALLGHAAAVTKLGRGLAMAGFSGAGKSTLSLHVMAGDAIFVSNDRLMVTPSGDGLRMSGVAKLPRINPGTILNNPKLGVLLSAAEKAQFSALGREELWNLEHKYDVPIETCFGADRFVLSAEMTGLVILNWQHSDAPTRVAVVDPAQRSDLLPAFMKSTGLFFLPHAECRMPAPTLENYTDLLSRCTVIEISGGVDFAKAAQTCLRFLESGRP